MKKGLLTEERVSGSRVGWTSLLSTSQNSYRNGYIEEALVLCGKVIISLGNSMLQNGKILSASKEFETFLCLKRNSVIAIVSFILLLVESTAVLIFLFPMVVHTI
jgi:hypothetical protein